MSKDNHQHPPPAIHGDQYFRRLLELSFDGVWAVDSGLRTSYVNVRMADMLGYAPAEMLGRSLFDFLFPEDVPAEQAAIARRRNGVSEQFELRYRRKDGSELWTRVATAPILASDGEFQGAIAIHSDVTNRRHMEEVLQERAEELQQTERLAQIGSWQWIPHAGALLWSEGLYQITGRDPKSPPPKYDEQAQIYKRESWSRLNAATQETLATGRPYELDLELVCPNGTTRWVIARGEAVHDPHGRVIKVRGTIQDITDRKLAENASQKLAAIVESSEDAIVSKDLNGIINSWNSAAARIFGYTAEEAIGKSIHMLIPPNLHGEEDTILARLRRGERIEHFETKRVRKDGRLLDVSLTISPIRRADGKVVGASKVARDITERKRTQEALLTSEKLATAGRLAATVAHEINNPLESIMNLVYLAKASNRDPLVDHYLSTAEEELDRVAQIAKQTLTFYRERTEKSRVRASELLRQVVAVFSSRAQNKGIRIELEILHDPEIMVDRSEFRQVFANLISNSIDACQRGGVIRVRQSTRAIPPSEPTLVVTVADNGTGINPVDRPHVFEAFFTTKRDIGTGLGLWVSKQIVDKYGGRIFIHSNNKPGQSWTVISVFLPVVAQAKPAMSQTLNYAA